MTSRPTVQDVLDQGQRDEEDESVWERQKWAQSPRPRPSVRPHRWAQRCQEDYARERFECRQEQRRLRREADRQWDLHMDAFFLSMLDDYPQPDSPVLP